MADIVEKVLFPGWQKNLSVTVRQFKYLAGGTANCSASPCMTLQTAPTGKAASILTVIGFSRRMWPTYFSTFSTVSARTVHQDASGLFLLFHRYRACRSGATTFQLTSASRWKSSVKGCGFFGHPSNGPAKYVCRACPSASAAVRQ